MESSIAAIKFRMASSAFYQNLSDEERQFVRQISTDLTSSRELFCQTHGYSLFLYREAWSTAWEKVPRWLGNLGKREKQREFAGRPDRSVLTRWLRENHYHRL